MLIQMTVMEKYYRIIDIYYDYTVERIGKSSLYT